MTAKEFKYMESTLHKATIERENQTWMKAFRLFNNAQIPMNRKIMNSSPNYKIVLEWHKKNSTK